MRVTNNTMVHSIVRYLTRQNEAIFDRQNIIASGKKINKPSDDPLGMGRVLDYRQTIASIEQYQTNIQSGKTRLGVIEANLDLVDDLMEVVGAIAQTEIGGTTESRQLAAESLKDVYDQILDQANSKFNDNYLFSGYQTKTAPFSRDDTQATTFDQFTVTYNGEVINGKQPSDIVLSGITQVMEGRRVFGELTVDENLVCGGITITSCALRCGFG